MISKYIKVFSGTAVGAAVCNILLAYAAFMLCRVVYFIENWSVFAPYMSWSLAGSMLRGGLIFDLSALMYINALYLLLTLLPLHYKETSAFHKIAKWIFIVPNALGIAMNLADAVYFTYTGRRTTGTVFSEFSNESNIASIIGTEFLRHWYLVLIFAVMVYLLWRLYRTPRPLCRNSHLRYYITQSVALILTVPLSIVGMRGSTAFGTRPITISNANEYVHRAIETSVVLNTPFALMRTVGKPSHIVPNYMSDRQMNSIYTPEHYFAQRADESLRNRKNIVILICESLGKEYSKYFNPTLEGGKYAGYMPFVDSLAAHSLTFKYSFSNGRISMDANPSILAGIPMFVEPFVLSSASLNEVKGLPAILGKYGYRSAFFHGGHNITMGFAAFANSIGFDSYYGLNEYEKSPKYGGYADFDGKWAIFDEPFLQYVADEIEGFKQPFLATVFTATSHHPYPIPEKYKKQFPEEGSLEILKCIRYADMSLRRFFDRMKHEPWYRNTLFVIVADHTNESCHPEYKTDLGLFSVPIIFFTPDGSLKPEMRTDIIAEQIDITPTILSYLGNQSAYMSFGEDLLTTPPQDSRAVNYNNGIYQYIKGDYMLQFDGTSTKAIYAFKTDPMLRHNLIGKVPQQAAMELELKAIIQQYMQRMVQNRLTIAR